MRQVGDAGEDAAQLLVRGGRRRIQPFQLFLELARLFHQRRRIFLRALFAAYLFAESVASRLQGLGFRDELSPLGIERGKIAQQSRGILPAGTQLLFDQREVGPNELQIVHTHPC
jgi:hypothetical protein